VEATLTQLRRDKAKIVRPVMGGGEKLPLNKRGQPRAKKMPSRKIDRLAACQDLMSINPVEFLPRK